MWISQPVALALALVLLGVLLGGLVTGYASRRRWGHRRDALVLANSEITDAGAARELQITEREHEMKGSLAVILGWSYLLRNAQNPPLGDQLDAIHDRIIRSGESLRLQVDTLLSQHKNRIEIAQAQWREFDLSHKVDALCADYVQAVDQHCLEAQLQPECFVFSSEYGVEQIFGHLVDNAAKYSPPGSIINVALKREHDSLILSVTDQGPGFPADIALRAPFVQGANPSSQPGVGLGLFIAESWATALKGSLSLLNSESGGAIASLRIPISAAPNLG